MPNSFCSTDDLMTWLMEHADEVNGWRKATITVEFFQGRMVSVTKHVEERVGFEIKPDSSKPARR